MFLQHRVNDGVRTNECPGVRLRGALSSFGASDFEHHDGFARCRAYIRRRQELIGIAKLLHKTADDLRVFVVGKKFQAIGQLQVRLIARTDRMRHTNTPIHAYLHHINCQAAALKGQRQLAWLHGRIRPRHARVVVRHTQVAKTVRTHDAHPGTLHEVREQAMTPRAFRTSDLLEAAR